MTVVIAMPHLKWAGHDFFYSECCATIEKYLADFKKPLAITALKLCIVKKKKNQYQQGVVTFSRILYTTYTVFVPFLNAKKVKRGVLPENLGII